VAPLRVVQQQPHPLSKRHRVRDQKARLAIDDRFLQSTLAPGHDWHARGHCFEWRHAELLAKWREHGHRCAAVGRGEIG